MAVAEERCAAVKEGGGFHSEVDIAEIFGELRLEMTTGRREDKEEAMMWKEPRFGESKACREPTQRKKRRVNIRWHFWSG
jgi:hypothetical protein